MHIDQRETCIWFQPEKYTIQPIALLTYAAKKTEFAKNLQYIIGRLRPIIRVQLGTTLALPQTKRVRPILVVR